VADNEHTAAALGDSKPLSVKNSVGEPIPELAQRPEEGSKIPPFAATEDARHVFPYDPLGLHDSSKLDESEGQVATRVSQSSSKPCDGEGLARGASDQKVNWAVAIKHLLRDLGHVAHIREPEAVLDNGGRERLYLARP
jgi:hypothetical protein